MVKVYGQTKGYLLFTDDVNAVVVDKLTNMIDEVGSLALLASLQPWDTESISAEESCYDLATGALADLRVHAVVASGRMYTIPKGAQEEAKKALAWRAEYSRGGTPVGLNSARTLAAGGQIGIQKVRHITKYFPRHEVDKKGKGWKIGTPGFPSNGRIAWALWGGDTAWRWAQAIVERENKKALRADGGLYSQDGSSYEDYKFATAYDSDVDAFQDAYTLSDEFGPEFVARVRLDGSGIDRLYQISAEGSVTVWDGNSWDDLGQVDSDIMTYDKSLDDPDDDVQKSHIILDPDSALVLSAHMQEHPFSSVTVDDLDPEEASLVHDAASEIDWEFIDDTIVAAGEAPATATDGKYTPEERSQKARKQVRDAGGKFSAMGSRVVVSGNDGVTGRGNITRINPDSQSVTVKLDSGESIDVPAIATQGEADYKAVAVSTSKNSQGIDVTGILGKPRTPIDRPNATIPGTLPALTPAAIQEVLYNFPAWVKSERDSFTPTPASPKPGSSVDKIEKDYRAQREKETGIDYSDPGDLRKHPLFKSIFKKDKSLNLYYSPSSRGVVSAAEMPKTDGKPETIGELAKKHEGIGEEVTPDTSDVQPVFIAIVSPDDPSAVFDLVSIVPAGTQSNTPVTFKRVNQKWEKDTDILSDLNSPTPPPVVALDGEALVDVMKQIDGPIAASALSEFAQGGADRNRGNAERLRHYWTFGKGAIKIRWNTPGDWTRCYRNLMKYMGPRAKGYCALRHKEVTGVWPGSKLNVGKKNTRLASAGYVDTYLLDEESLLNKITLRASANAARERVLLAGGIMQSEGSKFIIPLVIPEDVESGDGRKFKKDSITMRELPLPLMWQIKTANGHDGAVVVGRIDSMVRTDKGIGNAHGVFDGGAYGREAERMVRDGFMRGVSADLDQFEASEDAEDEAKIADNKIGGNKITITQARVMGVTIVPKPAFEECMIALEQPAEDTQQQEAEVIPDGVYVDDMDAIEAQSLVACGMIASSIPNVPPAEWMSNPNLSGPTPLTVTDDGRVFGHIAAWHVDHIGMSYGTKPPKSRSQYSYFHTGVLRADDGRDYQVGQLTLAGGHASLEASAIDAARHYDDTGSAIADVHAGEDRFGIWVAGSLRPSATPEQIRALRASAPSGDWRPIKGNLELVAVCQVNVPGFPIARARVASGQVYALVAAGAQVLARMKSDPVSDLVARVAKLEMTTNPELAAQAANAKSRIDSFVAERNAELAIRAENAARRIRGDADYESFAYISNEARQRLAKEKKALPDGSYPIRNASDLKNAIQAYGRSKPGDRAKVRRHIMKRARALGKADVIPEEWKSASSIGEDVADLRAYVASIEAQIPNADTDQK